MRVHHAISLHVASRHGVRASRLQLQAHQLPAERGVEPAPCVEHARVVDDGAKRLQMEGDVADRQRAPVDPRRVGCRRMPCSRIEDDRGAGGPGGADRSVCGGERPWWEQVVASRWKGLLLSAP